jgi:hypothetical protein
MTKAKFTLICPCCGRSFLSRFETLKKYCGTKCKNRAFYERKTGCATRANQWGEK